MAKVRLLTELSNLTTLPEFIKYCSQAVTDLAGAVNGGLNFNENIASQQVVVGFSGAATDVKITHTLNKTGVVYLVAQKGSPCDIYDGVGTPTKGQIFLRSNTAGVTVTLILS